MQIHQLPEQQTVADSDMFAVDTGQTTRRTPFSAIKTAISTFAHQLTNLTETTATSDSDVLPIDDGTGAKKITFGNLKNKITESANPAFNSGDSSSSTTWTAVSVLASGETIPSILNKISLMFKNIRYLYYKIGNNNVSGTGKSSLTAIIGNTSLASIGNGTLSGAVSTLNSTVSSLSASVPNKADRAHISWSTTFTFSMPHGSNAFLVSNANLVVMLWNPTDNINYSLLHGSLTGITITRDASNTSLITVTSTSNRSWGAIIII